MKTALVTSLGSVSADCVIKSLKRMGFRVVGCDIYPKEWVAVAGDVDVFYRAPLVVNAQEYLDFVHKVCEDEKVNYMLPLIDYEIDLLNQNREWFENHGICLCMSPKESLNIIRDKKVLADFIDENCPSVLSIPTVRLCDMKDRCWDFPLVCKPYNGRSSQGLKYIHDEEEWEKFLATADKNAYIAEPFIKGPIVMVEIVRNSRQNRTVAIVRQELLATPHGCGLTVHLYQDKKLEESCMELAEKLNIEGSVNFEFIRDEKNNYHFVECNPRFSAGVNFSCLSGYEVIVNHMRCFMGEDIDTFTFRNDRYVARKYVEVVTKITKE